MAHGGHPKAVLSVDLDVHDDEVVILRVVEAFVLERPGVDAASPLAVGTNPDAPVAGLCHGHDGRGIALEKMAHELTSRPDDVDAVLVCTLPGYTMAVEKYADHTG